MKKKKALCLASMASNLDNFNRNNVKVLQSLGYEVTLASNFHSDEDSNSSEKIAAFVKEMRKANVRIVQINFSRKISNITGQLHSYYQVKKLLSQGFDLIHCHSPICAAITRICARKYQKAGKTRVVYTAHGFHFYDGAPKKNWIVYYPIEKFLSRYTDVLITINKEDYNRALKKFRARKTVYVPGIGVDVDKFEKVCIDRKAKRSELGLTNNDIMILSVGELNENKNHSVVVKALGLIKEPRIHYFIAGKGSLDHYLKNLAAKYDVNLHLLGFRTDVAELYKCADIYVLPSIREGLNVSVMEAMSSGLACIVSDIRGNKDLIDNKKGGFLIPALDVKPYKKAILDFLSKPNGFGMYNSQKAKKYDKSIIDANMLSIYKALGF